MSYAQFTRLSVGNLAGYAAFGWGLIFAAISFYWGMGGTLGVDTVWGASAADAGHSSLLRGAAWFTGFLKVIAALLALALVSHWGQRLPRRPVGLLAGRPPWS